MNSPYTVNGFVHDGNHRYADTYGIANKDGTLKAVWTSTGLSLTGTWAISGVTTLPNGSAADPALAFTNSTTTGFYRVAADVVGVALAGVSGLAVAGSSPTFAAATDTAGQDVYIRAPSGGATPTAARVGGALNIKPGQGSTSAAAVAAGSGGALVIAGANGGANTGGATGQAGGSGGTGTFGGGNGGNTNSTGAHAAGDGAAATLAGGAGGNASAGTGNGGTGGNAVVTPGPGGTSAGGTAGVAGVVRLAGPVATASVASQAAATVANGGTISRAQHRGMVVYQDASGGDVTMTTRTGTQLDGDFPNLSTGDFVWLFCSSNHETNTSTVAGGTDVTLVGSGALTQTGGTFILRRTAATTFDLVRVG